MDVESQKNSSRSRVRCLDVFLLVSVVSLFLAVVAVSGLGLLTISELRLSLKSRTTVNVQPSWLTEPASTVYKMHNFAYLRAATSEPRNCTLPLSPIAYGAGRTVGAIYHYNAAQNALQLTRRASYFLYLDLNLTCTASCPPAHLTVAVGDHLTCRVELPKWAESTPITRKCWAVTQMEAGSRLVAQMTVSEKGAELWRLSESRSGLGIFLVD